MIKVPTGLLTNVIFAFTGDPQNPEVLPALKGEKPTMLAVTLRRILSKVREFDAAFREEKLDPAIREFTDGGDTVDAKDVPVFMQKYQDLFNEEVEIDIDPIPISDLDVPGLKVVNDGAFDLLLSLGVFVDASRISE